MGVSVALHEKKRYSMVLMLKNVLGKSKTKVKLLPSKHEKLFQFYYLPTKKTLWMDVVADVDLSLCISFMQDATAFLDQQDAPISIVLNLTHVKKFDSSCTQCFQTKELPPFIEHHNLKEEVYISAPPFIKIMIDLAKMFTAKPLQIFDTEAEALQHLKVQK
jgi:hypothetical protein